MSTAHATDGTVTPPSLALAMSELPRTLLDMGALGLGVAPLLARAPRGDGHLVLVLPGLLASNVSTTVMRAFLRFLGYEVHGWSLGRNLGPRAIGQRGERLEAELDRIFEESGRRISLVGWSLGGLMARVMTQRAPDKVRQVITLGSGFAGSAQATNAWRIYEHVSGEKVSARSNRRLTRETARSPQVPSTSIFTRGDGIVAWRSCVGPGRDRSDNIRVRGSHCGLGFNPAALYAVAERLAQPEGEWWPFTGGDSNRLLFPEV